MKAWKTEENSIIFDFWENCKKLSNLIVYNRPNSNLVKWEKCNKKSLKCTYTEKLFEVDIKKKRDEKARRKEQEYIDSMKMEEEDREDFEWKIWLCDVDLEDNLQCLFCLQTFWFECMVKWMSINQTCPYWERKITKSNIRPNKEKKLFLDRKNNENKKTKKPKCEAHYKNWALYWVNWVTFICNKWIISKKHNNHEIIETREWIKKLMEKVKFEINSKKSKLKRRKEQITEAEFNIHLNKQILKKAFDSTNQSIKNAFEWLEIKMDSIIISKEKLLWSKMNECNEADNILQLFIDNQDPKLFEKVARSLQVKRDSKDENDSSIEAFRKELANNEMIVESFDKRFSFMYSLSKLYKQDCLLFNAKTPDYELSIKKEVLREGIAIWIDLEEKDKSLWYCKLGLDDNKYWCLKEQKIRNIYSNEGPTEIDELVLKIDKKSIENDYQVTFNVYLLKADEKMENHIRDTEELILKKMIKMFKDKYNIKNDSIFNIKKESIIKQVVDRKGDKKVKTEENVKINNKDSNKEEEKEVEDEDEEKEVEDEDEEKHKESKLKKVMKDKNYNEKEIKLKVKQRKINKKIIIKQES